MHTTRRQPITAAALSGATAVRAVAAWCLDVHAVGEADRPSIVPVFVAVARAVVSPSPDAFDAIAAALAAWCQLAVSTVQRGGAEAPMYRDEVTAPLMARAVDVAALAGQAALDAGGLAGLEHGADN